MERVDIVVLGLDPARPRAEVIASLAERLARTAVEIELLLEIAPAPLVRAVSPEDAEKLLVDLAALGVRVKQRTGAADAPSAEPIAKPASPPAAPTPVERAASSPDAPADRTTDAVTSPPPPILVKDPADWFGGASTAPAPPADASAPPLDPASAARTSLSPARFGRTSAPPATRKRAARRFFAELPSIGAMPLRGQGPRAHATAALLAVLAMTLALVGLNADLTLGTFAVAIALTAAVGFVGLVHQLAASCSYAATAGDREPGALPDRLVPDYLGFGLFAGVVVGGALTLAVEGATRLTAMRATLLTMSLYWGAITFVLVLGFTLATAGRSALGYLDVARMGMLLRRAPLEVLVITLALGGPLAACVFGLAACFRVAADAHVFLTIVLNVGVLGAIVAFALSYVAAVVGGAMGLLIASTEAPRE